MSNSRVVWLSEDDPADSFPPVSTALQEPDGLLAAGGDLSVERLLCAYQRGIFPWYDDGQPLLWWSPDPRCVFMPGDYRVARRLRQELRGSSAEIRVNTAFSEVIRACAAPRRSEQGTWITTDMMTAYENLHAEGWAHSIELWQSGKLAGGLYGLAIGKAFFGESMFSSAPNASKLTLLYLANLLTAGDLQLIDCQLVSSHLLSLGARIIPRSEFLDSLAIACDPFEPVRTWPGSPLACSEIFCD
jgi:leucyl/phenylalanyl-tRNA--protein transferase